MRFTLSVALAAALAGCSSSPGNNGRNDELHTGNFEEVHTSFWADPIGFGASHVSQRKAADGASITREHLLACDPIDETEPAFWADLSLETAADFRTSRAYLIAGLGHETVSEPSRLVLERTPSGRWKRLREDASEEDLEAFDSCEDVEIEGDHVTQTVAVRRHALKPGETADFDRLLVKLPGMDVEKVKRRLTRVDETKWALESLGADGAPAWRLELTTDASGNVVALNAPKLQHRVIRDKVIH